MKKDTFFIILATTLMVFSGYHFSNEKDVNKSNQLIKEHQSEVSIGLKKTNSSKEATIKDWDKLFDKIIDKKG